MMTFPSNALFITEQTALNGIVSLVPEIGKLIFIVFIHYFKKMEPTRMNATTILIPTLISFATRLVLLQTEL